MLYEVHFGEGGYAETELAIGELLGLDVTPVAPFHPEDDPTAMLVVPTEDQPGQWSGPYEAGGVWAVLEGDGEITANDETVVVDHAGAYPLVLHDHHTEAVLDLRVGDGVVCHAVCFTAGLAVD
jgi:hypothetical protein